MTADITGLLIAWRRGDEAALDRLMSVMYPELRRIARVHLSPRRRGQTMESASLANEAYLKLIRSGSLDVENRVHFLSLCSRIIRQILVDHARSRNYAKRGGRVAKVTLDETIPGAQGRSIEVLDLNQALESLAKFDQRKVRVIELRYFAGLSLNETAVALDISAETAKRDWRMAKALLRLALSKGAA